MSMEVHRRIDNILGNRVHLCDSLSSWFHIQKPKPTVFFLSDFHIKNSEISNPLQRGREDKLFGNSICRSLVSATWELGTGGAIWIKK